MKKIIAAFLLIFTFNLGATAQSKEEKAVAVAVETMRKAMIDGDKNGLQSIAAEELSYGHSSGKVQNKAEFVDGIASGASDFVTIDLTEQTIKVIGNTALVRHKLSAQTNDGGKPGSVSLGILLVWQKQKGQWKLIARQAYKL
ncbi:MAG: nuclear transport factor 2 family protein [Filimonas sp.]|nr:nuclear transport factor 2 family protein [Filimonas sp.]